MKGKGYKKTVKIAEVPGRRGVMSFRKTVRKGGKTFSKSVKSVRKNFRNKEAPGRKDDRIVNSLFKTAAMKIKRIVRNEERPDRKDGKTVGRIFKNIGVDVRKTVRSGARPDRKDDRTVGRISKVVVNGDEESLVKSKVKSEEVKVEANREWDNSARVRVEAVPSLVRGKAKNVVEVRREWGKGNRGNGVAVSVKADKSENYF
ncbi:MAG: hypothetical protein H8E42_08595 [Nitrospinae bacterium]|nr:hypothetical protein [Nitrospinota bacterium]MBL7020798.1 hypothetical protein [Nitrospinaceae bacterium]